MRFASSGKLFFFVLILIAAFVAYYFRPKEDSVNDSSRPSILVTTTIAADMVKQVVGDHFRVYSLMGPDTDPHTYQPSSQDIIELEKASVVIYSGLMLEGKMTQLFEAIRQNKKKWVYSLADSLEKKDLIYAKNDYYRPDPHVWFDATLWERCARNFTEELVRHYPDLEEDFRHNFRELSQRFLDLHQWVKDRLSVVPPNRRVLVTSHDAFSYMGRAYDIEVVGVQGMSTSAQSGLADLSQIVAFIKERNVPAIFPERSVSPALVRRIQHDAGVQLGRELYSDALGESVDTWTKMMRHNINAIVDALVLNLHQR